MDPIQGILCANDTISLIKANAGKPASRVRERILKILEACQDHAALLNMPPPVLLHGLALHLAYKAFLDTDKENKAKRKCTNKVLQARMAAVEDGFGLQANQRPYSLHCLHP